MFSVIIVKSYINIAVRYRIGYNVYKEFLPIRKRAPKKKGD